MRKLKILGNGVSLVGFLLIALTGSLVYAEVPHTFSPGTPAKASEVNANFQNLDTRIASLENNSGGESGTNGYPDGYALDYKFKKSTSGNEISVGGKKFRIVKMPIKTPDGKKYAITLPARVSGDSPRFDITVRDIRYTNSDNSDYPFTPNAAINGFPAALYVKTEWNFSQTRIAGQMRYTIEIHINEFRIFIDMTSPDSNKGACKVARLFDDGLGIDTPDEVLGTTGEGGGLGATPPDYTSLDLTALQNNTTLIGYLDELVDYINVEPMQ